MSDSDSFGLSVYQQALGDDFPALDPALQKYFGRIPQGCIGSGSGVYSVAGSRHRYLRPVFAVMAWRNVLFPELGYDVPFRIVNNPGTDGTLSGTRTFHFAGCTRVMEDTMTVVNGAFHDRLGKRRGLDVTIRLTVAEGGLQMTSTHLAFRVGPLRIPLPRVVTMHLDERTHAPDPSRQQVDVRITAPLIGELFRYTGTFTYAITPIP